MERTKRRQRNTSTEYDPVTDYAKQVVSGKILAGPHVRYACARHVDDLKNGPKRGLKWDLAAAIRAINFFPDVLRLHGGEHEGQPLNLLLWQCFIVGSLFGWKGSDGFRRFRMAFVETGKGSGKSPIAAGIGLYMMTADKEPSAEIYAAAAKKDQAKVLFRDAVAMVEQSPELLDRLHLSGGKEKHNIAHILSRSFFRPISTESRGKGQSGPRPHCALLDEIHEHPSNAMVEFMRAGTKGRRQALIFMITNSGSDRLSVCYDYHEYGTKVCARQIEDDSFFAYICALDESDDPFKDKSCWPKANPSLGVTFTEKYLAEQVTQARGMPSKQNIVLRLNFCRWTDVESAWISREAWESCEVDELRDVTGRKCYGGLDLSKMLDLTAMARVWPAEDGTFDAEVEFWTPKDTIGEREDKDRVPYRLWRDQGFLHDPPGKAIGYGFVAQRLGECDAAGGFEAIAYDRWRIEDLKRELDDRGLDLPILPFGQGYKEMAPAIDEIESAIINGKLRVKFNPVLRWNASSAMLVPDDSGNRKFTKRKATGRIDGIIALTMALKLAAGSIGGESPLSAYETQNLQGAG